MTFCSVLLAVLIFCFKKREPTTIAAGEGRVIDTSWLRGNPHPLTPVKDVRPADQTFLTFPEWYLVFSPEEQAEYFKHRTSTSFPFMEHVAQFWQSYRIVNNQIKDVFPPNKGYHLMIWVIGTSTTAEYAIKEWYETVVGRLTDTKVAITAEDRFNAAFTGDYVRFIKDRPWYEYNFTKRLKTLWSEVPVSGGHLLRAMERRYILSSELIVKAAYGKLIGLGTKTVYDEAMPTTGVVVDSLSISSASTGQKLPDGSTLVYLPRYDRFKDTTIPLADAGVHFKEVAGNNSAILFTVIVPDSINLNPANAKLLFTQPIASDRTKKRLAFVTTVPLLGQLLHELGGCKVFVEHVFDY
jgi:hypothetical protein